MRCGWRRATAFRRGRPAITRLEFGQAVCGTVALRRRPIVATHIQQSDEPMVQLVKSFGIRAYACNPLLAGDRLLGTLSFASRTKDEFDADEVAFLKRSATTSPSHTSGCGC